MEMTKSKVIVSYQTWATVLFWLLAHDTGAFAPSTSRGLVLSNHLLLPTIPVASSLNFHDNHYGVHPNQRRQPLGLLTVLCATVSPDSVESTTASPTERNLMKRDRYVATNRFAVRKDKAAKFEQRWATRSSRLAQLEGFRYFHLMRRVRRQEADGAFRYDGGDQSDATAQDNYVSFTVWEKKSHFSAWRKGDAFKEAHGGTSIGAFLSTMLNSALVLRGPPRPAFYDGLYTTSVVPKALPETVNGWRAVPADGVQTLPMESCVCMEKYYIPREKAESFEQLPFWQTRMASMKECQGFVTAILMRRDGQAKGHGTVPVDETEPTYVTTVIFNDRAKFEQWESATKGDIPEQIRNLSWKEPEKVYYEGTLVIATPPGA